MFWFIFLKAEGIAPVYCNIHLTKDYGNASKCIKTKSGQTHPLYWDLIPDVTYPLATATLIHR